MTLQLMTEMLKTLNNLVKDRKSFSAYDITKALRGDLNLNAIFHKDVKPLVHEFMKTLVDIGNYTVTDNGTYKVYSPLDLENYDLGLEEEYNLEPLNWSPANLFFSDKEIKNLNAKANPQAESQSKGDKFWDSVVSHSEAVSKAKECKSCDPDCAKQVCKKVEDKKEKNLLDKPAPKLTQTEADLQLLQQFSQLISDLFYKKK